MNMKKAVFQMQYFFGERNFPPKESVLLYLQKILNSQISTNPNLLVFSSLNTIEAKAYLNADSNEVINKYLKYVKNIIFTKYNFSSDKNLKK